MKSLPLPIRVAAGLAVTAVEQARTLPAKIAGLPVTVASQALQVSMRVQQQVTELAIRGDEVLASLQPVEEAPEWATFDEDLDDDGFDLSRPTPFESAFDRVEDEPDGPDRRNGHRTATGETFATSDPWADEEQALAAEADAHADPADDTLADDTELADVVPLTSDIDLTSDVDLAEDAGLAGDAEFADDARLTDEVDLAGDDAESAALGDDVESAEGGSLPEAAEYDELSLPQLRARLRRYSPDELARLLDYERAHGNRPSFVGMLTRRIATVRDQK